MNVHNKFSLLSKLYHFMHLKRFFLHPLACAILSLTTIVSAHSAQACVLDESILIATCNQPATLQLRALSSENPAPAGSLSTLVVTGTYSSADRYGIEGLAIANGELVSARFQGWDGLALINATGELSLHHVERVNLLGRKFNLRETRDRTAFLNFAVGMKLSVIQSHLLVVDGAVDIKPQPERPLFTRRMLYTTRSGHWGIFDTGNKRFTLYDATIKLNELVAPLMAFNLDMGAYNYCMIKGVACGLLPNSSTKILTNVLIAEF